MQASLANVINGQGDNEDVHFEDTVRGSDWGADRFVLQEMLMPYEHLLPERFRGRNERIDAMVGERAAHGAL